MLEITLQALPLVITGLMTLAAMYFAPKLARYLKARLTEAERGALLSMADAAFDVVSNMARKSDSKIADKAVEGFRIMRERLGRELTGEEKQAAEDRFTAKHNANKRSGSVTLMAVQVEPSVSKTWDPPPRR